MASRTRSLVGRVPLRGTAREREPAKPDTMRVMVGRAYPGASPGWNDGTVGDTMHGQRAIDQSVLDTLWDFADPAGSAERFQAAADDPEFRDEAREEIATQLARAL